MWRVSYKMCVWRKVSEMCQNYWNVWPCNFFFVSFFLIGSIHERISLPPLPQCFPPPSPHFNFSDDNLVDMKNRRKTFHVLPAENYNWYLESSKEKKLMKSFRRWDSTWLNQLMICYETLLPIRICFLLKAKRVQWHMQRLKNLN